MYHREGETSEGCTAHAYATDFKGYRRKLRGFSVHCIVYLIKCHLLSLLLYHGTFHFPLLPWTLFKLVSSASVLPQGEPARRSIAEFKPYATWMGNPQEKPLVIHAIFCSLPCPFFIYFQWHFRSILFHSDGFSVLFKKLTTSRNDIKYPRRFHGLQSLPHILVSNTPIGTCFSFSSCVYVYKCKSRWHYLKTFLD